MTLHHTQNNILDSITRHSPMPDHESVEMIMQICRRRFFPGFYRQEADDIGHMQYLLRTQLERILPQDDTTSVSIDVIIDEFTASLPELQNMLADDVSAAYEGDPAANSCEEVVLCYPGIYAVTNYRVAHRLYELGIPLIPRMITEQAHSKTGIDIHPGARIGRRFMIDHGTGVVIGATAVIGDNVKIYQGVTLGARSFTLDQSGNPVKGLHRHPTVCDNVVIYANATLLGTITVGKDSVIGGNLWVTFDVPPGVRLLQSKPEENIIIK